MPFFTCAGYVKSEQIGGAESGWIPPWWVDSLTPVGYNEHTESTQGGGGHAVCLHRAVCGWDLLYRMDQ